MWWWWGGGRGGSGAEWICWKNKKKFLTKIFFFRLRVEWSSRNLWKNDICLSKGSRNKKSSGGCVLQFFLKKYLKVSEYPFKQNKNTLKNKEVLFIHIFINFLKCTKRLSTINFHPNLWPISHYLWNPLPPPY